MASAAYAPTQLNGINTSTATEDEELYDQLLRIRDVVIAGKHETIRLPESAIERLKAAALVSDAQHPLKSGVNEAAFSTNHEQLQHSSSFPASSFLPGLSNLLPPSINGDASSHGTKPASSAGLDPIFLQKSDSLVRAEGQLKRQRLDRDIQAQVDQRKHSSRDKDNGVDAPSPVDVNVVLLNALGRVAPQSGLRTAKRAKSSSIDENDYYSSRSPVAFGSEQSSSKGSEEDAGAFTADFERLDGTPKHSRALNERHSRRQVAAPSKDVWQNGPEDHSHGYANDDEDAYEPEDPDDYVPWEPSALDSLPENRVAMNAGQVTPPEDDNSDYEPGELTESNVPTPQYQNQQSAETSPRVPLIRNHLTHIAAPQPNRVSPLATAKGPSIELELVNGRPEVVQNPQKRQHQFHSRASTASPSGTGMNGNSKKRRKKRKRDVEPAGRAKRRRERHAAVESAGASYQEPYIKDEPISPPPFSNVQDIPPYPQPPFSSSQYRPDELEIISPRHAPQMQHANEPPRSGLRYEYAQPTSPAVVRMASPANNRPVQRDTQDLRRVASLHYAQLPPSPRQQAYSPVGPYRTVSMTYGDQRLAQSTLGSEDNGIQHYQSQSVPGPSQYSRNERSRSPPRMQEYEDIYAGRASSPAMMPPPTAAPRRIVVDQYGNRYYAAEPVRQPMPDPAPVSRATAAPVERRGHPELTYERASSRASFAHPSHARESNPYEPVDSRMAPPPPPARRVEPERQKVEYVDINGYPARPYNSRPSEPPRQEQAMTSPVYQQVQGYGQFQQPPSQATREPTSPNFVSTGFNIRPDEQSHLQQGYVRHASVAPVQYVRHDAPSTMRAVSVMPSAQYDAQKAPQNQYQSYTQAPQGVRYVDQYGNEVFAQQVRQVGEYRY